MSLTRVTTLLVALAVVVLAEFVWFRPRRVAKRDGRPVWAINLFPSSIDVGLPATSLPLDRSYRTVEFTVQREGEVRWWIEYGGGGLAFKSRASIIGRHTLDGDGHVESRYYAPAVHWVGAGVPALVLASFVAISLRSTGVDLELGLLVVMVIGIGVLFGISFVRLATAALLESNTRSQVNGVHRLLELHAQLGRSYVLPRAGNDAPPQAPASSRSGQPSAQ